jgi:hypothetical protein
MPDGRLLGIGANFVNQGTKLFHNVVDRFDQACTVADQAMAAPAGQAVGRARYREDFAILFHGVRRGRERPAARGRFDDQDTKGQPGDDPVALGEQTWVTIGASGPCAWRSEFGGLEKRRDPWHPTDCFSHTCEDHC